EQTAVITDERMLTFDGPLPTRDLDFAEQTIRIGTKGRARSVIRANKDKWLHPDLLMVKRTFQEGNHDRRAFFSFDLSDVDFENISSARLRLNQVPSGIGYATRIPKVNQFGVYGMDHEATASWSESCSWEESPAPEDGSLLGTFEVPRSRQDGSYGIKNEELLQFLKSHAGSSVTFVLDRLTTQIPGEVPGLVHAFASDSHPEVSGPILEFVLKD
ncbi:MAG: iron dicitrate transport regulator FecR, partial [Verrucomicrobiota bacterium]